MYFISEKIVYVGLYVRDCGFSKHILNFNANLISKGVDQQLFLPVQQLHVTLVKIDLGKSILNKATFAKLLRLLNSVCSKFTFKKLSSHKFLFGETSKSIKVYLDVKSTNFINKVREFIIRELNCLSGINYYDEGSFVPHLTILPSTNKLKFNEICTIKSLIRSIDDNSIPDISIRSCSMLLPSDHFSNDIKTQSLIAAAKKLAIQFH